MTNFDPTNRGAIFTNDRKERDSQPDRTGSINVEGIEYFIDGWLKESRDGKKFLSLSVKRKDKQPTQAPQARSAPPPRTHGDRPGGSKAKPPVSEGFDDDIPF